MASRTLYPPSIASSLPAFMASSEVVKIPISFSKFNNTIDFTSAHISIMKKDTGTSVVNTEDDLVNGRYRATGIILNVPVLSSIENGITTYYVEIKSSDLNSKVHDFSGWIPGWFYKVQVRLSSVNYPGEGGQQAWLNANASNFSEWSTVCIIKSIGDIIIDLDSPDYFYTTSHKNNKDSEIFGNNLTFSGKYFCEDVTETLACYRLKLFKYPKEKDSEPIDDSGYIYNNAVSLNEFNYVFKAIPEEDVNKYVIEVEYNTINDYSDNFNINFILSVIALDPIGARVVTVDNDADGLLNNVSSLGLEEDEGRIALKIDSTESSPFSGNLVVRRASSRTNFLVWEDIKILNFKQELIKDSKVFYDYTIESGIWYKYGVQSINDKNERSKINITPPIIRNFNFSYLLGENNQQLKLMFNNNLDSFRRQVADSHTDTLGGKYAVFSRNAAVDYKTFPINGLISFFMDEQNTFTNKKIVYGDKEIVDLYDNYNYDNKINQYDYIYEREFRDLVSNFLYDGKPKLFKSTTEGNIIVRITDVAFSPHQNLNRIIYSFSSTGFEIDESTIDNYKKYNLIDLGEIEDDFSVSTLKIGQLIGTFNITDNIISLITAKYNKDNDIGYNHRVGSIKDIKIQIESPPMRVMNNAGNYVLGYNIKLKESLITLKNDNSFYEVDSSIDFNPLDSLFLLGDADGEIQQIDAVIDFIYEDIVSVYEPKKIASKTTRNGLGQIFGSFEPNSPLYQIIESKYNYDWAQKFCKLNRITGIEIESVPNAVFYVQDSSEQTGEYHLINATGILYIDDISDIIQIKYIGIKDPETGEIDPVRKADIILNYYYVVVEGSYQC